MYLFFGLTGLVGVLAPILKKKLPDVENFKFLLLLMAYIMEAIFFKSHLFGGNKMDRYLHAFLVS